MNISKTMKIAALLAASSASLAQASSPVKLTITGSTAFRAATENAIANTLTSPTASYATKTGSATTIDMADYVTFTGKSSNTTYNVLLSWSGSESGIAATAQTTAPLPTAQFLTVADNVQTTVTPAVAPAILTGGNQVGLTTGGPASVFENDVSNVCMSDGWQASTPFHGTYVGTTYAALTGDDIASTPGVSVIGVVPFEFVASLLDSNGNSYAPAVYTGSLSTTAGSTAATLDSVVTGLKQGALISGNPNVRANTSIQILAGGGTSVTLSSPATATGDTATTFDYTGLSNISDNLARKTFESAGQSVALLSQFSGSNQDAGISVLAVGRNHDSGTRNAMVLNTMIDKAGTATTAIQQYYPLDPNGLVIGTTGAATTIASTELVPAEMINGINYNQGQSGYSSGGSLAKVFTATNDLPNTLFISYLGLNDAKTALGGNAQALSYAGFYYSQTAVQQGQYTFWSYEHLYYKSALGSLQKGFANSIANQLATSDALVSGILTNSAFKASRVPNTTDGAIVTR